MNLSVGIVGLPNVGKSTLFNVLLKKQQALVANYPFATIEPNVGVVAVADARLAKLAEITALELASPVVKRPLPDLLPRLGRGQVLKGKGTSLMLPPIKPAMISFVDIAGLVKGASEGAGLGNKFLSHIREVSVIVHVVRAFVDEDVVREGSVDPRSDYETINTELLLADLITISKIKDSSYAKASADKQKSKLLKQTAEKLFDSLNKGVPAREVVLSSEEAEVAKHFFLLSAKQEIVVLNVAEEDYTSQGIEKIIVQYTSILDIGGEMVVVICAKIESELAALSESEQREYLKGLELEESGLERLIKKAYDTLGLISFLTCGEKEVKAWTIRRGFTSLMASGEIHTDFMKKFIKAEVVSYEDFVGVGGWKKARELGKARQEGRDYIMQDGDVVEFKIGS